MHDPGHEVVDGKYRLSETQARAILELRLQRLTGMERDKLTAETAELADKIRDFLEILQSRPRRLQVMREELVEVRDQFGTPLAIWSALFAAAILAGVLVTLLDALQRLTLRRMGMRA